MNIKLACLFINLQSDTTISNISQHSICGLYVSFLAQEKQIDRELCLIYTSLKFFSYIPFLVWRLICINILDIAHPILRLIDLT